MLRRMWETLPSRAMMIQAAIDFREEEIVD